MKKIITFSAAIAIFVLLSALISSPVSVKNSEKAGVQKAIPAGVMKIIDKSCAGCHNEPGMKMAVAVLDLSNWDKYPTAKQAAKASKMCKFVTKGKMPPKRFKTNNPDLVPTKADINTICEWSASLKVAK